MKRSKKQGAVLVTVALLMMQGMATVSAGMGEVDYSSLPGKDARLHWDAVGTAPQPEEKKAQETVQAPKAMPIIITAADIDAQKKARKKAEAGAQSQTPMPVVQKPLVPPAPAPAKPDKVEPLTGKVVELPPIQAVEVKMPPAIVELPPIEKVPAKVVAKQTVELPPIQPVK